MHNGGIALFGGTFDPIHHGHLLAARAVAEQLSLDRVVFVPAPNPPHKIGHELSDAADRLEMVRRAIEGEPRFEVSDIEIRRSGPSYTVLTVQEYRQLVGPGVPLVWIIGGDSLPELHSWYRVSELVQLCRVVTAVRPSYEMPELTALQGCLPGPMLEQLKQDVLATPRIDISSTDIRRRIRDGRPIRYLLPDRVIEYIQSRGLYRCDAIA
ncbi:MAG: nicotinate-nucleotide adenylyltransferase [Phycisphaerae bacterium]|nr:nicotinate-nucleotide adenylyltransferase [Phycisphaerae bacterium]